MTVKPPSERVDIAAVTTLSEARDPVIRSTALCAAVGLAVGALCRDAALWLTWSLAPALPGPAPDCDAAGALDCALEIAPVVAAWGVELLVYLAAITLALAVAGASLVVVSGVRIIRSHRRYRPQSRLNYLLLAGGVAVLVPSGRVLVGIALT